MKSVLFILGLMVLLSVSEAVPANFPFIAPWVNIPRWMPINWALANIAVKQMLGPMWWPGNVQSAKGRVAMGPWPRFRYYKITFFAAPFFRYCHVFVEWPFGPPLLRKRFTFDWHGRSRCY